MMFKRAIILSILILVLGLAAGTLIGQQTSNKQTTSIEEDRLKILQEDIAKKTEELKKLKSEIEAKIKQQEELKAQLEKSQQENYQRLAKIYEAMPPEEAASRIEKLDEDTAVALLLAIKPRQAGKILANINPEKAAILSKKIVSIKEKSSR
ncbi:MULTISPECIES: MotE family protein [Thermodesulfovibrio]|uniref:Magnesium transporter MgtE intracellular domain-containing protein n=1 Tax=Thermodesulfovibrio obliviosus TaxID=3118332 RepID=A0AAU8H1U1_9BACT